jgi:hypothetical protein
VAVTGAVLLVLAVLGAVLFPAFPYIRPVLVNVQTALQFLWRPSPTPSAIS